MDRDLQTRLHDQFEWWAGQWQRVSDLKVSAPDGIADLGSMREYPIPGIFVARIDYCPHPPFRVGFWFLEIKDGSFKWLAEARTEKGKRLVEQWRKESIGL